ncbi:MAG TPA: carboxymuconolactone decarboxylase family protein [Pyrinomonadaceae bacterium]|jgi:AhpD family alkylhydroperoxidase|nr:carboxymuconolactone decarboxylase family protein [Pyrinomonadaceae bacterium]
MRIEYNKVAPEAFRAMFGLEQYLSKSEVEPSLLLLIKFRVSQINGCGYCLDMHSKDARALGETEQRLYCLPAWRETTFYTDRERAALEWAEELTLISGNEISDEKYERVRKHFSEKELVDLTMAVVAINGWNRLSIGFAADVGSYQVQETAKHTTGQ